MSDVTKQCVPRARVGSLRCAAAMQAHDQLGLAGTQFQFFDQALRAHPLANQPDGVGVGLFGGLLRLDDVEPLPCHTQLALELTQTPVQATGPTGQPLQAARLLLLALLQVIEPRQQVALGALLSDTWTYRPVAPASV